MSASSMPPGPGLPSASGLASGAYAAALSELPGVGPGALRKILDASGARQAWERVVSGHPLDVDGAWRSAARAFDVAEHWKSLAAQGIGVLVRGDPGYPDALVQDVQAPAVLFFRGDPSVIDGTPRVGIVGTRSATRYGLGVAAQLGAELAAAGVAVVSGLALGVDGAAHEGAVAGWEAGHPTSAPPVAVVAGGLDRPYPLRHARLWRRVADAGAVLSESPVRSAPASWRFPQRNRILAALSEVLIVVECHQLGGSLHTVRAAERRGIAVGAVPGSIRSPASAGTNDLLADGCFPVRDTTDVLVALDLARAGSRPVRARRERSSPSPGAAGGPGAPAPVPGGALGARLSTATSEPFDVRRSGEPLDEETVLDAIGWERCSLDQILRRTGGSLAEVSLQLERLSSHGRLVSDGSVWERP